MWLHATDACCVKLSPEECGWFFDSYLKPTWFVGDPTPLQVEDILSKLQQKESDEELELDFDLGTSDESESE